MKSIKILFFSLLFFYSIGGLSYKTFAQEVPLSIKTKMATDSLKIGDQRIVDIWIEQPVDIQTKLIFPTDSLASKYEFLGITQADTIVKGINKTIHLQTAITSFDSVNLTISPIAVTTGNDTVFSKSTYTIPLLIPHVDLKHPEEFKSIKSVWKIPYTLNDILKIILESPITWIILTILILLLLWYFFYYRRKKRKVEIEQLKDPKDEALISLEDLKAKNYPNKGLHKRYYTDLVYIIKHYVERKKGISVLDLPTTDFLAILKEDQNEGINQDLQEVLKTADLAKFAQYKSSAEEDTKSLILSKRFISKADELWTPKEIEENIEENSSNEKGHLKDHPKGETNDLFNQNNAKKEYNQENMKGGEK